MHRFTARARAFVRAALAAVCLAAMAAPALAVVPSSSTLASYASSKAYIVNCSGLNLRCGASVSSDVQFVLPRGTTVTYISDKSGWWYVSCKRGSTTYYGWVDKKYLAPAATGAATGSYAVNASRLNVRVYPRLSARVTGSPPQGAIIRVTELNGDWGYSPTAGGWVALAYLSPVSSSGQAAASVTPGSTYRVIASKLTVRASASSDGAIKDGLFGGVSVTVTRVSGGWAYVTYRGGEGWVSASYLG